MENRIFRPLLLQRIDGETAEQFLSPEEIVLECRDEQALAEAARAAEEINLSFRHEVINQCRLVNINVTVFTYLLKALYSYRVLHRNAFYISAAKIQIIFLFAKEKMVKV